MNSSRLRRAIISFALTVLVLFVFLLVKNVRVTHFDAQGYWDMSKTFLSGGRFVFPEEEFYYRGYSWPMILFFLNGGGRFPFPLYWLLLSAFYGFFFAVVGPALFEELLHRDITVTQRIIPPVLLMIFWPGLIVHPLSDVAAPLILLVAAYVILQLKKTASAIKCLFCGIIAGLAVDTALNVRSVYVYNIYLAAALIVILCLKNGGKGWKERVVRGVKKIIPALLGLVLGVMVAAAPQVYANVRNYDKFSMDNPLTWMYEGRGVPDWSLYLLWEGLIMPRYESYAGGDPSISPRYMTYDPVMTEIFRREGVDLIEKDGLQQIDPDDISYGGYIKMYFKYPVEVICVMLTHLVNNLDTRYGEVLLTGFGGRQWKQVISTIVYMIAGIGVYLLAKKVRRDNGGKFPYIRCIFSDRFLIAAYLLFPTIVAFPGHCDPRHSLPAQLVMYYFIAYSVDVRKGVLPWVKKHWLLIIVIFILFITTVTAIQNYSLSFAGYRGLLF